jgi:hypothetical protein
MIRYTLKCADGHEFESWFQSTEAYDRLAGAGRLSCPQCGANRVEKSLMTPRVRPARAAVKAPGREGPTEGATAHGAYLDKDVRPGGALSASTPAEAAIAALRRHVEATADYVGNDFAKEARRIHDGEAAERPIWGEARLGETKALIEDGIPVAPLPFRPTRKSN